MLYLKRTYPKNHSGLSRITNLNGIYVIENQIQIFLMTSKTAFLSKQKYSEFWSLMKWIVHFHPLIISRYPAEESGHGNMSKYNINIEWLSYCRKAFYGFPNKNEGIVKIIYDIAKIHILRLQKLIHWLFNPNLLAICFHGLQLYYQQ